MSGIRNYNAEVCGKVPLHHTNLIQPHGVLLIPKKDDFSILQASENDNAVFDHPALALVTKKPDDFIANDEMTRFSRLKDSTGLEKHPLWLTVNGNLFLTTVNQQDAFFLLGIEKAPHEQGSHLTFASICQEVKYTMAAIETSKGTEETCILEVLT